MLHVLELFDSNVRGLLLKGKTIKVRHPLPHLVDIGLDGRLQDQLYPAQLQAVGVFLIELVKPAHGFFVLNVQLT